MCVLILLGLLYEEGIIQPNQKKKTKAAPLTHLTA